jgi:sulfatase maturation enzyme AslB (radical SAM superfamily)
MSLEKTFCSSPWFHMRINNSGTYEPCRWQSHNRNTRVNFVHNIKNTTPLQYFQQSMSDLRIRLLSGESLEMCHDCVKMEQHGKVSGRQRQLLKVGIQEKYFEKSLASSPFRPKFDYSADNQGHTLGTVGDWQIDLGNYCNGACIYCNPESSSSLATEFKKIGLIDQLPPASWCDDPVLVDRFIQDLKQNSDLHYLHFLGGETVITPGFRQILTALVESDMSSKISIGFTTNLTVWSDSIIDLLCNFKQVNLGMSIESLNPINDYVRYPSQIDRVKQTLDRWVKLGQEQKWLIQLRITPTCLTVQDLSLIYEYAWQNNLVVESCNFIDNPKFLRIGVLPLEYRTRAKENLQNWIATHSVDNSGQIINIRNPDQTKNQIVQDAQSYLDYLSNSEDESHRLPDLVAYLKRLESNRGNSILTYLPQYEDLFRSAGY